MDDRLSDSSVEKLIERLEKATGPERGLDVQIARATNADKNCRIEDDGGFSVWADDEVLGEGQSAGWFRGGGEIPRFSESIDSALTLVPEGMRWVIEFGPPDGIAATIYPDWDADPFYKISAFSNTPAIALCIAALKARSSK